MGPWLSQDIAPAF